MRDVLEMTRGCTSLACFSTRTDCSKLARGSRIFLWGFQHDGENIGELKTPRQLHSLTSREAQTTARRSGPPARPEARARRGAGALCGRAAGRAAPREAGWEPRPRAISELPARLPSPEAAGRPSGSRRAGEGRRDAKRQHAAWLRAELYRTFLPAGRCSFFSWQSTVRSRARRTRRTAENQQATECREQRDGTAPGQPAPFLPQGKLCVSRRYSKYYRAAKQNLVLKKRTRHNGIQPCSVHSECFGSFVRSFLGQSERPVVISGGKGSGGAASVGSGPRAACWKQV